MGIPLMEAVAATGTLVAHCPFPALNMNKLVLSLSDLPLAARAEPQLASLKSPCTVTGSQASLESKFKSPLVIIFKTLFFKLYWLKHLATDNKKDTIKNKKKKKKKKKKS